MTFIRVYRIRKLNGVVRRFSSVFSFDGYVKELRRNGCVVTFIDPFSCFVRPAP